MTLSTILYIVFAAIIAFVMVFFHYFFKKKQPAPIILAILRFLAIFFILLLLINPKIKSNVYEQIKPTLQVIADNSSSIKFMDQDTEVAAIINSIKSNQALQDKFNINYYSLSDDLHPFDSLTFKEPETNILKGLQTLKDVNTEKSAPIILLSDGNQTYGSSYAYYHSKQAIYPVVLGDTIRHEDLRLNRINANSYTSLNNQFPVEVFAQYDGVESIRKNFTVRSNNKVVFQKTIDFSSLKKVQRIQFNLLASSVGVHNYSCSIDLLIDEKNKVNNRRNFSIEVINEQSKVLILSDIKHPDVSMLKRSIETNKQRKVIIEHSLRKMDQLGTYQLVILYQPNRKFEKIIKNNIDKDVNFFIITGSQTDWRFLNEIQPYFKKNYIVKNENYGAQFNADYNEFIIDEANFNEWPPLRDQFGEIRFSAPHKVLLYQTISNFTTENPLLVTLEKGSKRAAFLFGEGAWKWRMFAYTDQQSYEKFDTFFNKLIQYLSSHKRSRQLEIDYKPFVYANSLVTINAQYFDANYNFDKAANLVLSLRQRSTNKVEELPFTLKENTFEVQLNNLEIGDYNFTVLTDNQTIKKSGAFTMLNYEIEKQFSTANVNDLKKIAQASNGRLFYNNETKTLFETLLSDNRYQTVQRSSEKIVSLIEWKWLLGMVVLFLSTEWFLRKYRGLI